MAVQELKDMFLEDRLARTTWEENTSKDMKEIKSAMLKVDQMQKDFEEYRTATDSGINSIIERLDKMRSVECDETNDAEDSAQPRMKSSKNGESREVDDSHVRALADRIAVLEKQKNMPRSSSEPPPDRVPERARSGDADPCKVWVLGFKRELLKTKLTKIGKKLSQAQCPLGWTGPKSRRTTSKTSSLFHSIINSVLQNLCKIVSTIPYNLTDTPCGFALTDRSKFAIRTVSWVTCGNALKTS